MEGGSANAYDYVDQDPVNSFDVAGTCLFGKHKGGGCVGGSIGKGLKAAYRHLGVEHGECLVLCWSVSFQHGHIYASAGICACVVGKGFSPTFFAASTRQRW